MAGSKTGTWSIVQDARHMARMFQKYGAVDMVSRTSQDFYDCVVALIQCYIVLQSTDDYLLQVERTLPAGPEDQVGP